MRPGDLTNYRIMRLLSKKNIKSFIVIIASIHVPQFGHAYILVEVLLDINQLGPEEATLLDTPQDLFDKQSLQNTIKSISCHHRESCITFSFATSV